MSKNRNKNGEENTNKGVKIHEDAREFAELKFKKFKKKNEDYFDKKKEVVIGYHLYLIDLLPKTIEFCVKYGYIKNPEVQETKDAIYEKLVDEDFVKTLKKEVKGGNKIENIKWMPIIINEILQKTDRYNKELLAKDPNAKIYKLNDLIELSQLILKKKLKKFDKNGVEAALAFDCLSVIPTDEVMEFSRNYRIHMLMDVLYEHAKTEKVPFEDIMDILLGEEYYSTIVLFALLERKEKFGSLNDMQKTLYMDISTWCFNMMEKEFSSAELNDMIKIYINARKRDEAQNKDGNRRYSLSTLSETDYPRIAKFIQGLIAKDDTVKKYL